MSVHASLLRADLRARWRGLCLFGLLVGAVAAAVLTALGAAQRTEVAVDGFMAEARPFDATVFLSGPGQPAADIEGASAAVETVEGVAAAVGIRWFGVFPGDVESEFFPMVVPADARVPDELMRYPLVEGRRPHPDAPSEVALGERSARRLGVEVGDDLPAAGYTAQQLADEVSTGAPPPGSPFTFDVVGIVRTPGDLVSREDDLEINLLTPAFAERYRDEVGLFGSGVLVFPEPDADMDAVGRVIADELGPIEFDRFFGREMVETQATPTLDAMAMGLRIVAAVLLLVGGALIVLSLARDATDRLPGLAPLRAIGVEPRSAGAHLVLGNVMVGLAGLGIGIVASVALVPHALWGLAASAEVDRSARLDGALLLVGGAVAVALLGGVAVLVALATVRRGRLEADDRSRAVTLATRAAQWGAPLAVVTGLRLAFDRGRGTRSTPVAAACAAAALGAVGVMTATVFSASLDRAVTDPRVFGWGMDAALNRDGPLEVLPPEEDGHLAAMADDPSFSAVAEYLLDFDVLVDGTPEYASVLDDVAGHTPFVISRGREPLAPDEIAMGALTLAEHDLEVGDTVTVGRDPDEWPDLAGIELEMEVVGVAVLPVDGDGGLASAGVAFRGDAARSLGFSGFCTYDESCSRGVAVTVVPGADVEAAAEPYRSAGFAVNLPVPPSEVQRLTAIDRLPGPVGMFLIAISVATLAHTAVVTVRRRRVDLAVLRALGFSRDGLRTAVLVQIGTLALLGGMAGTVIGLVAGRQLWRGVASGVDLPAVVVASPAAGLGLPVALVCLALATALLPGRSAARVHPGDVLRAE